MILPGKPQVLEIKLFTFACHQRQQAKQATTDPHHHQQWITPTALVFHSFICSPQISRFLPLPLINISTTDQHVSCIKTLLICIVRAFHVFVDTFFCKRKTVLYLKKPPRYIRVYRVCMCWYKCSDLKVLQLIYSSVSRCNYALWLQQLERRYIVECIFL